MTTTIKQETTKSIIQFKVQKMDFAKALATTSGAISTKSTLPILNNILIDATNPNSILLTGTDLELGIRTQCIADVSVCGVVTAPAKKLFEIIRELPMEEIEVTVAKNNAVNIKTAKSFFKIMGLEPDDFPKLPEPTPEQSFELDQEVLRKCLTLTSFATSRDEARYTLNGVLLSLKGKSLCFVATDGKRLAFIEQVIDATKNLTLEAIVPVKTVFELTKALGDGESKVKVLVAQNQIAFQVGQTLFVSRLIEGRFPNYEQVIPKDFKTTTKVRREELLAAIRRVSLLTSQENQAVKLDFIKDRILISSRSPNLGEAKEEIESDISGEDLSIGFNPNFLIDALKTLDDEELTFVLSEPDRPGILKNNQGYIYVVMPMQLS